MSGVFEFVAEVRGATGSSAAKVVRRIGRVPAIVYGGQGEPQMISLDHNEIVKHLTHKEVYTSVLDLNVAGKTEKAILKHIQRHPAKSQILHIDFMRVVG